MVFHLDYDRRSDIDDSVGYWFIQPRGPEECRVYYSCVTKLRSWVPGPVYALLTKQALKQATSWVDFEAVKEWGVQKSSRQGGMRMPSPKDLARGLRERVGLVRLPEAPRLPQLQGGLGSWMRERQQRETKVGGAARAGATLTAAAAPLAFASQSQRRQAFAGGQRVLRMTRLNTGAKASKAS